MKPTIGRIVHFVLDPEKSPIAAIITAVWSDTCVNLRIFQDGSNTQPTQFNEWITSITYDGSQNPLGRSWHWPPGTMGEKGWLDQVLSDATAQVERWPDWMKDSSDDVRASSDGCVREAEIGEPEQDR